uniref:Uncharacterized protein n=1 Tax=Rhizophora mucronata TaxID=61149 RepID=A0A2P2QSH6_RHIMU
MNFPPTNIIIMIHIHCANLHSFSHLVHETWNLNFGFIYPWLWLWNMCLVLLQDCLHFNDSFFLVMALTQ